MPDGKDLRQKTLVEMARSRLRLPEELVLLGIVLVEHPRPAWQLSVVQPIRAPVLGGLDEFPGEVPTMFQRPVKDDIDVGLQQGIRG